MIKLANEVISKLANYNINELLIIGSGGREHAIAWKVKQSKDVEQIYIAPGNAGTSELGINVDCSVNDFEKIKTIVKQHSIDMIIVGPEEPLVKGIVDYFKKQTDLPNLNIIGADMKSAQLEGSKDFAKKFMENYNIPTAKYKSFTKSTKNEAYEFLSQLKPPYVIKADGLAAGKGVIIVDDLEIAKSELSNMFEGKFGDAGSTVVIEEFLDGIELSVFVVTDGKNYKIFPEAKDYKRIGEQDTGLNTGGMGAVSPVPFANAGFLNKVEEKIIKPTIKGIINEKMDYKGFIFFGLMNVDNEPYVIEYNVRLGDPETEVIIPRLKTDLVEILKSLPEQKLDEQQVEFDTRTATTVMLVSQGYPEQYEKGKEIVIDKEIDNLKDVVVFHAGSKLSEDKIVTNGGRVISVTAYGNNLKNALSKSYSAIEKINFNGKTFRSDIGFDLNGK